MEKTSFTVKLEKVDAAAKTKLIKEIKSLIPGANLVEVTLIMILIEFKHTPIFPHPFFSFSSFSSRQRSL